MRVDGASLWLSIVLGAGTPLVAHATYSIVASDTRTQEVGGAGASCVYPNQVSVIFGVAPGFGAVHAQAQSSSAGRDRAAQLLLEGKSPSEIIAAITAASFDTMAARRQYGVVDVMGRSAGFTGAQNMVFADDVQGLRDGYAYSVQGNILTGRAVLDQAVQGFEGEGCDLADHLMRALEAGARNDQGDSRCINASGIVANSAFIQVDQRAVPAGAYLKLSAGSAAGTDPLPALRRAFDAWRVAHPCAPRVAGDAGVASSDAGAALLDAGFAASDAQVVSEAGVSFFDAASAAPEQADAARTAPVPTMLDAATEVRDAMSTSAAPPDAAVDGAVAGATSEDEDGDGCSAGRGRPASASALLLLAGLALSVRRSRRARRRVSARRSA